MVDEFSQPSFDQRLEIDKKYFYGYTPTQYYKHFGFDISTRVQPNGGLIVLSPQLHANQFEMLWNYSENIRFEHQVAITQWAWAEFREQLGAKKRDAYIDGLRAKAKIEKAGGKAIVLATAPAAE